MLRKIWFKDNSKERRKFIPALCKTLPTNPWCSHGCKNGSRLCGDFKNRDFKTAHLETIYRRHIFPLDFKERRYCSSLSKHTNTTPQLNLRLKFQKQKHFWIQTFIKVKDSEAIQFLMCVRTSNLLKHFNIRTSLRATHQGSKKASSKAKH